MVGAALILVAGVGWGAIAWWLLRNPPTMPAGLNTSRPWASEVRASRLTFRAAVATAAGHAAYALPRVDDDVMRDLRRFRLDSDDLVEFVIVVALGAGVVFAGRWLLHWVVDAVTRPVEKG